MAVYAITGKLGSGKGKGAMKLLRDYLRAGKRVATNCDIFMEHMMPGQSRQTVIRVPDKPTSADLYAIGSGNRFIDFEPLVKHTAKGFEYTPPAPRLLPGFDESYNGALFLDECASWLNTRDFQAGGRKELLEWAIHARKYGWDVYFICQNISKIDKQLRDSLFEYVVRMSRLDRMKVPFVSAAFKLVTAGFSDGSLPRMHIGVVRLGCSPEGVVADRWHFRGDDLNLAYNTTQVFSDSYPHAKDNAGNPVQNVVYRPSGVIVDVVAKVLGSGKVKIAIGGQISSFKATSTGVSGSSTLIKRQVKTTITVSDGEVLLLGGLNDSQSSKTSSGFSFFPSSWAVTSNSSTQTELVLVLSATTNI